MFTSLLIFGILIFTVLYINGKINNPGGNDHTGEFDFAGFTSQFVTVLFYVISNTIGDLSYPEYSQWVDLKDTHHYTA